jgi:type VI secretion system protein VasJ
VQQAILSCHRGTIFFIIKHNAGAKKDDSCMTCYLEALISKSQEIVMPEPEPQQTAAPPAEPPAPGAEQSEPLSPLLEAIKRPIPGGNPCGQEISGADEDFQRIREEINRIGTVSAKVDYDAATAAAQDVKGLTSAKLREMQKKGQTVESKSIISDTGGVDYALIIELAEKILAERSKDLRVVTYLCFALWKAQRFAGLAKGFAAIKILLQDFGEGMYPPKMRAAARKGAIEFLTNKLMDDLGAEDIKVGAEDAEPLKSAQANWAEVQKFFAAQMPQWETLLLGVAVAVEKCAGKVPKKKIEPQAQATPGPATGTAEGPTPAGPVSTPAPAIGEVKSEEAAIDFIRKAAGFWRGQDRKSAAPYRLVRSMRWDKLINEPPNENGKTKIPTPPEPQRKRLGGLQQSAQWEQLLNDGEASFTQPGFHLWLDLQRLLVAAMDALGSEYQHARMAILQELAILLQRVPKLPSLTFNDGTRFADAATQSWIEETVMPVLGSGEAGATGPTSTAELESHIASLFDEAKKLAAKGDLAAAIAYLQDGAAVDASGKNRFRLRLYMATLCLRGGQPKMARPMLEDLSEEIDKFSLAAWEPPLALEVWRSLHDCYGALAASAPPAGKPALLEHADRVFEKLCRLDLSYALTVSGTKPKSKRPALPKVVKSKPPLEDETEMTEVVADAMAVESDGKNQSASDGKPEVEPAAITEAANKPMK